MKTIKTKLFPGLLVLLLCLGVFATTAFAYVEGDVNADTGEEPAAETAEADEVMTENGTFTVSFDNIADSAALEPKKMGTVVNTDGANLNVRSGSGLDYEVIDQLNPGDTVEVIEEDGDWYKVTISEKTGYVSKDYLRVTTENSSSGLSLNLDEDMIDLLFQLLAQGMTADTSNSAALTPDGNLTLVDDIGSATGAGKQFITVATKTGNYFYIVIDRDDEGESTVHFLNQVDERDLLALMDEEEAEEYQTSVTAPEEPVVEEPAPDTSEIEPEPEQELEPEKKSGNMLLVVILLLALIGGGGAFVYGQMKKKKQAAQENPDPDADYLEDEDDTFDLPEDEGDDTGETSAFDDDPDDEPV